MSKVNIKANTMEEAILAAGLGEPDEIIDDGEIHRFEGIDDKPGSYNCWYVSHGAAGAFGSWKTGEKHKWRSGRRVSSGKMSRADVEQRKKARRAAQRKKWSNAARLAKKAWSDAPQEPHLNAYTIRKDITPYGARGNATVILVPMYLDGQLVNLQSILFNGGKYFAKGGQITGCCMSIGDDPSKLIICEGWATGCALYEHTGDTVIVAFNAGNLKAVALWIRKRYPKAEILIAADNDAGTAAKTGVNPGLKKAEEAAAAIGVEYIFPEFTDEELAEGNYSDYQDYFQLGGIL